MTGLWNIFHALAHILNLHGSSDVTHLEKERELSQLLKPRFGPAPFFPPNTHQVTAQFIDDLKGLIKEALEQYARLH